MLHYNIDTQTGYQVLQLHVLRRRVDIKVNYWFDKEVYKSYYKLKSILINFRDIQ